MSKKLQFVARWRFEHPFMGLSFCLALGKLKVTGLWLLKFKMKKGKNTLFYGWLILAVATVALIVSNGLAIGGVPVFYKYIREDFVANGFIEASKAESFIAYGATLTFLFSGISSLFAGWLLRKISILKTLVTGCLILGSALLIFAYCSSENTFYFARLLMGFSLGFIGVLANSVLVSNWFIRQRGVALGILLMGTSIGGFTIPQIANPLIQQYGWRTALLILSLIIWCILLPAILFLVKNNPAEIGLLPDGDTEIDSIQNCIGETGLSLVEALKTPVFWIFALCAALIFYPIFVTSQQFILYLQSPKIGLSSAAGASAISILFAVSIIGKSFFGFLSDKFPPQRIMLVCCLVMFLATLLLLNLSAANAFIFLIPFGLGYGGTFVLLQRLVADLFGNRDYPKILGAITVVETIGAAIGGIVTGKLADAAAGDYTKAFYMVIVATGLAVLLVSILNLIGKRRLGAN